MPKWSLGSLIVCLNGRNHTVSKKSYPRPNGRNKHAQMVAINMPKWSLLYIPIVIPIVIL